MPLLPTTCLPLRFGGLSPLLLAVALLSLILATGCGFSHETVGQQTLTLSTWGSQEEVTLLHHQLEQFEKAHPHVRIKLLHIPENYFQKLHILMAGDLAPDVMFVNSLSFPVYAHYNLLAPLDRMLAQPYSSVHSQDFYKPALEALSWQGRLYALPRDVSDLVVFYNQDLFDQAGLASPTPHWRLEEMVQWGKALTRDTDKDGRLDQFGISFYAKPPLFWLPFVWTAGGDIFDADFTQLELDSPQALQGLQRYADLRHRWHIAPTPRDVGSATMSQLFIQGKLAMMISGRWTVPVLRQQAHFHWDVLPFPRDKTLGQVGIDASGYAISAKTRYPEVAQQLVMYLSSKQAQTALTQSGLIVPARMDVANSPAFLTQPPQHAQVFLEALANGRPTHVPLRWNEISEALNLALEPVFESGQPVGPALKAVKPGIEKMLP